MKEKQAFLAEKNLIFYQLFSAQNAFSLHEVLTEYRPMPGCEVDLPRELLAQRPHNPQPNPLVTGNSIIITGNRSITLLDPVTTATGMMM